MAGNYNSQYIHISDIVKMLLEVRKYVLERVCSRTEFQVRDRATREVDRRTRSQSLKNLQTRCNGEKIAVKLRLDAKLEFGGKASTYNITYYLNYNYN